MKTLAFTLIAIGTGLASVGILYAISRVIWLIRIAWNWRHNKAREDFMQAMHGTEPEPYGEASTLDHPDSQRPAKKEPREAEPMGA